MAGPECSLILRYAQRAGEKVVRRVRRQLQGMKGDHLQSGEDSGLENIWDEVCVQVQRDYSVMWWAYLDVIDRLMMREIEKIDQLDLEALWFQTSEGERWIEEVESGGDWNGSRSAEIGDEEIVELLRTHLLDLAADYSNRRIERFRERDYGF